jgi:preprotein translocase subunit YajC
LESDHPDARTFVGWALQRMQGPGARGIIHDLLSGVARNVCQYRYLRDKLMNLPMSILLAQAAPAAGAQGNPLMGLALPILLLVVMFFVMIRPQMKRQKEHRAMVSALAKGDEVVTNGGIAGRVEEIGESFVTVEIAPNVKIKLQKGAVQQVLPKGTLKSS